jgi:hypothetical protein
MDDTQIARAAHGTQSQAHGTQSQEYQDAACDSTAWHPGCAAQDLHEWRVLSSQCDTADQPIHRSARVARSNA